MKIKEEQGAYVQAPCSSLIFALLKAFVHNQVY